MTACVCGQGEGVTAAAQAEESPHQQLLAVSGENTREQLPGWDWEGVGRLEGRKYKYLNFIPWLEFLFRLVKMEFVIIS